MRRLRIAVLGLVVALGTSLFAGNATVAAAPSVSKDSRQESKKQDTKNTKLDDIVCEYFKTYFDSSVTAKNITNKQTISKDYEGNPVTPYVVFELADGNSKYRAVLKEDGSILHLSVHDNKEASAMVSEDDPYFKEKMAYDLDSIKLPTLSKCKELALDFIDGYNLAGDSKLTYVGEVTTDMLSSTILYQYDEDKIISVLISSQFKKVIGLGYMDDTKEAADMCEAGVYREKGGIG